jgi:hypothetical protein
MDTTQWLREREPTVPDRSIRIRSDLDTRGIGGPVFDVISKPRTGS